MTENLGTKHRVFISTSPIVHIKKLGPWNINKVYTNPPINLDRVESYSIGHDKEVLGGLVLDGHDVCQMYFRMVSGDVVTWTFHNEESRQIRLNFLEG